MKSLKALADAPQAHVDEAVQMHLVMARNMLCAAIAKMEKNKPPEGGG